MTSAAESSRGFQIPLVARGTADKEHDFARLSLSERLFAASFARRARQRRRAVPVPQPLSGSRSRSVGSNPGHTKIELQPDEVGRERQISICPSRLFALGNEFGWSMVPQGPW
jgi:hypothetical protein